MMKTFQALFLVLLLLSSPLCFGFAVATGTRQASETAAEILRQGGNAADAAVAASFVLNVTQPYNMGIGGGGFFLAENNGRVFFWDHREAAPASAHEKMFLDSSGKPIPYYPERVSGPNPVGVPGTVLGLYEAHRKLGKLPWKRLLQPAIKFAREGFPITPKFEEHLREEWDRISKFPLTASLFGDGEGSYLKAGRVLRNPMLAETLEKLANRGALDFYQGELAHSWLAEAQKLGVKITLDDLRAYKVRAVDPIHFKLFGHNAVTAPPPSASGVMVAGTLRYLERYYHDHPIASPLSAARVIVTTEAMKYFQALRNRTIGDAPYGKLDPQKFLGSPDEKSAWAELDKLVAARLEKIQTKYTNTETPRRVAQMAAASDSSHSHTTHLSVVDDRGMAVSYTTTIEQWFGSGLLVPGHGFLLNNELSDFTPEPGQPNSPAAGKRPRSNMSPLIFFDPEYPKAADAVVGCAGGGHIPTTLVVLLENYYLHKMTAYEAIAATRFHPDGDKLEVEASMPKSTLQELKSAGYNLEITPASTTAQALMRRGAADRWDAASEPRADSLALSYEPLKKR